LVREAIRAPGHDRARSLGWNAVAWIESFCVHGPGDVEGEPVSLDDEFVELVVDAYALDERGRRAYDSVHISRAKGRAKSELAGFIALFEGFGDCRFDRWAHGGEPRLWRGQEIGDTYLPGEPIGRPVTHPFIRCLATEEGQAGNTYDNIYFNLTNGPLARGLPRDAAGLTRTILPHGGEIVPSTASSAAKDGGKETHAVFDEVHLYTLADLKRMYRTVRRNLAKRKAAEPWSLETTTMFAPGEESVAEESHRLARLILAGKTRRARLFFDHRYHPADFDLTDERLLRAALREVYGPFADVMDLERIINEFYDVRNPLNDSIRYFLNCETSAADAWLSHTEIAGAVDATKVVADGEMIGLGFDGSKGSAPDRVADSTAIVATRISDGHQFEVGVAGKDWSPPEHEVEAVLAATHERYQVVGFFGDPAGWTEPMARWSSRWGVHYLVKKTRDQPIKWKTNQHTHWAETLKAYHDSIVTGATTIDGSAAFVRHLGNARRRVTKSGITISKATPESPDKIDLTIAGTYSYAVRIAALELGVLNVAESFVPVRIR
jgi:hypothetical protein